MPFKIRRKKCLIAYCRETFFRMKVQGVTAVRCLKWGDFFLGGISTEVDIIYIP